MLHVFIADKQRDRKYLIVSSSVYKIPSKQVME